MQFAKIQTDMWSDPEFESLSKDVKLLWIYFLSNSRNNFAGIYEISTKRIKLETEIENLKEPLKELTNTLPIVYDYPTNTVWIKNFLSKYHPNKKQLKGVGKFLDKVKKPSLVQDFLEYNDSLDIPYTYPMDTPGVDKDKDKDKDKEYNGDLEIEKTEGAKPNIYPDDFEKIWNNYPHKRGTKKATWRKWKARRNEKVENSKLLEAVENYTKEIENKGTDEQYIKHGETFFGPDEHWRKYLNGNFSEPNQNNGGRPSQVNDADRKAMAESRRRAKEGREND